MHWSECDPQGKEQGLAEKVARAVVLLKSSSFVRAANFFWVDRF